MKRRKQQKEDTRRLILGVACTLFGEQGYEKTTMRELARQAGVGLGTIFKHFPDKSSLLAAAFQEEVGEVLREGFETLPADNLKHQLLHLTQRLYAYYAGHQSFSRDLVKEALFLQGEYGEVLQAQVGAFLLEVEGLIKQARSHGAIGHHVEVHAGAWAYWSFYLAGLVKGLNDSEFDVAEQLSMVKQLLDGYFQETREEP